MFWTWYFGAVVFLFGLVFGSFLNCAGMRIAAGEDFVHGRSHCMSCGHTLSAADLVPVASYLFLRGRCRYCGEKMSARYPITELAFGLLSLGFFLRFGESVLFFRNWFLAGALFLLSIVDIESFQIPDGCLIAGALCWLVSEIARAVLSPETWSLKAAALHVGAGLFWGGAMLFFSLVMDHILGRESLGGGDVKLFALMGLYLGFAQGLFLLFLSSVLGLCFAAVERVLGRHSSSSRIPFGPAVSAAGCIMLAFGEQIADWYFGFFI